MEINSRYCFWEIIVSSWQILSNRFVISILIRDFSKILILVDLFDRAASISRVIMFKHMFSILRKIPNLSFFASLDEIWYIFLYNSKLLCTNGTFCKNSSGGGIKGHNLFEQIISLDNLFCAWREFQCGKMKKPDVREFAFALEDNIFSLHDELKNKTYRHSHYTSFYVSDPKLRHIHKACVRDRVLHHAIFRVLYPVFDKSFIFDSYSCRLKKGTHRAVDRLERFCLMVSQNNNYNFYYLKCDIKKFFVSVDQEILVCLIKKKIVDPDALWLIQEITNSFQTSNNKGLPLGNVTSQLLANIYLNKLDQFIKHQLKAKYYLRYCDDFLLLSPDKNLLVDYVGLIDDFLQNHLKLNLHPDKIIIKKYNQGIDWLGYVVLPHYRLLRTKTRHRIIERIKNKQRDFKSGVVSQEHFCQSVQSYLGVLEHCSGYKIEREMLRLVSND